MTLAEKEAALQDTELGWLAKAAKFHSVPTEEEKKSRFLEGIAQSRMDYYERMLDELMEHLEKRKRSSN